MSNRDETDGKKFDPGHSRAEVTARTGDRHELSDVPSRPLITFMIGVLIALGVVTVVVGGFGFLLYVRNQAENRPRSQLTTVTRAPPEPRLQSSPVADMERMRNEEDALLNSYGWVDRKAGTVRIPIEQSIALLSLRGLPAKRHDIPTTAGAVSATAATTVTTPAAPPPGR